MKIMIFRQVAQVSAEDFAKAMAENYPSDATIAPTSIKLGEAQYAGHRVRARLANHQFIQDVFSLPALGEQGRLVILQADGEGNSPENGPTRELLAKTFRVSK